MRLLLRPGLHLPISLIVFAYGYHMRKNGMAQVTRLFGAASLALACEYREELLLKLLVAHNTQSKQSNIPDIIMDRNFVNDPCTSWLFQVLREWVSLAFRGRGRRDGVVT